MQTDSQFKSFIQAGFECSSHRLRNGRRLDLIHSTHHDLLAAEDYRCLTKLGIRTIREGLRWHLIEAVKNQYEFSSILGMLDAAEDAGVELIIDLFHFGWPDHLDIFHSDFVDSFAQLAFEFARLLRARGAVCPFIAPVNEISFLSWAGGDTAYLNPFEHARGPELKRQLVKAGVRAANAFLCELPGTRLIWPEPAIHIVADSDAPDAVEKAERQRMYMYEVWDMLSGRLNPELGGSSQIMPMVGINFYDRNEWVDGGRSLERSDPLYRPFHQILLEVFRRYSVPMVVTETGTEGENRRQWFSYIAEEVRQAQVLGASIQGICLYPIANHPGWDDDRHCYNGLFDYPTLEGVRPIFTPLAEEIAWQQKLVSTI